MLGHKRVPSREGGIEIVVGELAARLAALGCSVVVYNRGGHHVAGSAFDAKARDRYKGVRLKTVFTIDKKGLAAVTSSAAAALCVALGRYDAVHFHAEGPCAMLWLPKLFGKRCVATIHGLDWQREKWKNSFATRYIRFGERVAARYADEIIVLSEGVQRYFLDRYGRKTIFIPNGVSRPHPLAADEITRRYGLQKDGYVLFVGRIVPEKGVRLLVEAFRRVETDKKLVIAGGSSDSDEYLSELKQLAAGDPRILFTGFVQGALLGELYSNAYLYTLPSDLEGMPLSLLEAMSYGNCCLVSDIPECREVANGETDLFKRGDAGDLARALQALLLDPDRVEEFRRASADFICAKYDWDDVTQRTLALYRGPQVESPDTVYLG
jgi:glycosyltransferase involved in cell wall biosynthesis